MKPSPGPAGSKLPAAAAPRLLEIDGLRGIAALSIAAYHRWYGPLFWCWSMVDLFFVISGFVITRQLLQAGPALNLRHFWIRRILRIWPVYYLMLAAAVGFILLRRQFGHDGDESLAGYSAAAVFLQYVVDYWHVPALTGGADPTAGLYLQGFAYSWSLAVEEQFYLLWPLLLLATRFSDRTVLWSFAALLMGGVLGWALGFKGMLLLTRGAGLAVGILLAWLEQSALPRTALRRVALALALTGAVFALPYLLWGYWQWWQLPRDDFGRWLQQYPYGPNILGFALLYGGLITALRAGSLAGLARLLSSAWLLWLGAVSYALYMVHGLLLDVLEIARIHFGAPSGWQVDAIYWPLALGLAAASQRWLEAPLRRYARRFRLAESATAAPASADASGRA